MRLQDENSQRVTLTRRILTYAKKPLLAAGIILIIDSLVLLIGMKSIEKSMLTLVLFFEGGLGLIAGTGIALSATPSISKFGELTMGTAAWSREGEKNAERVGWKWVFGSTVLILIAFAVSTI